MLECISVTMERHSGQVRMEDRDRTSTFTQTLLDSSACNKESTDSQNAEKHQDHKAPLGTADRNAKINIIVQVLKKKNLMKRIHKKETVHYNFN